MTEDFAKKGVYTMQVASDLTGLHPQTIRGYERDGLLTPARVKGLRLYSPNDINRLKHIKQLSEHGYNLEGIKLALKVNDSDDLQNIKKEIARKE